MNESEAWVRRHATGRTDQVTIRSYFRGARRWYAPWLFRYPMSFAHSGGTPADCAARFDQFVTELRQDARARGFVDGSVTWVTVRDYWTGAPDEDLNFIWAAHTPVVVRRLTIGPDLAVTDTGGIAREVR